MTHVDEGTIVAVRDGALVDGDAVVHLRDCSRCEEALEQARIRQRLIAEALGEVEARVDVGAAKDVVRTRLDREREDRDARTAPWRAHLGRAAVLLALAAGGVSALPGSPLRGWISGSTNTPEPAPEPTTAATSTAGTAPVGGVRVELLEGSVRIELSDLAPDAELEIAWTDASSAAVVAGEGTAYTLATGRVRAELSPGPVRVEIPRNTASVLIEVDGRTYVRRASEGLEVLVPAAELTRDRIRFAPAERE